MKKGFGPLAILLVVAVVLVLGGGVYYSNHHPQTDVETSADVDVSAGATTNVSLRSLLSMGRNVMCTFASANHGVSGTGTVYISGAMMRGDFTTQTQGSGTVESHIIKNGEVAYVWSGSQGAKMNFSNINTDAATQSQVQSSVNLDQNVDYKCSDWSVDSGKFTVPTAINFVDLNAALQGGAGAGTSGGTSASGSANLCVSVCAQLSGDAKTQCMTAYHCQ